jgi:hypothetical protein
MFTKLAALLFLELLLASWAGSAQEKPSRKLILRVDEKASGPYGGQKSSSCLRVFSDGEVVHARWENSLVTVVDADGRKSKPENTTSVEYHLEGYEIEGLSELFQSKAVKGLPEEFAPPHRPVDYIEITSVQMALPKGKSKQISTREYYVASLKEKTRYPAALVVLMEKIDAIEKVALDKGKPTEIPPDCQLKTENH